MFETTSLPHSVSRTGYRREQATLRDAPLDAQYDLAPGGRFPVQILIAGVEGAGKGETVNLLNESMDPRHIQTTAFGDPIDEQAEHPPHWPFWRAPPRRGRFAFFDRYWYGRVPEERIESFCAEPDWRCAYGEINQFEQALHRHGTVLVKFWLAVSKDEQYRRFKLREQVAFKRFTNSAEDWRNREKWGACGAVVCDIVDRTSAAAALWTLVKANNKYFARIEVLRTLSEAVEQALRLRRGKPRRPDGRGDT
jgi:AMP-polyphosphate phosphotransferase